MTLTEHIEDICKRLERNEFTNVAAVRQGIIERLLQALTWSTFDTKVVFPEYEIDSGKVDYALCHPPEQPRIFVKIVEQRGGLGRAEKQLFEYASESGVSIVVLTDGQKWRFFHPIERGESAEREVRELDLTESDTEESVVCLSRYLNYAAVRTGAAAKAIEKDYQKLAKQQQIEATLPEAWQKLLQEEDEFSEFLFEAVAGKTESLCGAGPTNEQVLTFLKSLRIEKPPVVRRSRQKRITRLRVTMSDGEVIELRHAKDTFVEVIEKLGLETISRLCPHIVSTEPFYKNRAKWQWQNIQRDRFYIDITSSTKRKKEYLEEIAGLLGVQLKVEIVDKS